ncbi:MAG: NAD+ synthase [Thermoplasmata archaeon]|nr:NAD+ synthase [Thermoplasmata archaeon]
MLRPVLKGDTQTVISWFLRHHVSAAEADGVVVGMSGGLDSTVVAKLAVDALGADSVLAVLMPDTSTPDECMEDARALAGEWGIVVREIDISDGVENIASMLDCEEKAALGNLKSRLRMVALYHLARKENLLVMGTGNKSELLTGYFTKFGDGASDLCPIADLYKAQVRKLAARIDIPKKIIDRVPSGDLWTGQTDEGELGIDYATLDRILLGIELGMADDTIVVSAEVSDTQVAHVRSLVKKSVHKRRLGLIPKLSARTVGLDWRESD